MVLAATLLWAVETVVAKQLLQSVSPAALASVRMGVGVAVLVGFVVVTGHGGALVHLDASQVGWALATGSLLAVYVGTWMVALSRGRAMDVTSVLVLSVVVTSLLEVGAGHAGSLGEALGLVLVMLGTAAVLVAWPRRALGAHQAGKLAPDYTPASR